MTRVRWMPPARRDFLSICDWIDAHNPGAAERVGRRLLDSCDQLGNMPFKGRVGRVEGTRELIIPGLPYVVVYRVDEGEETTVSVLRVLHGAMRWPPKEST